jgi:transposase InsO family protein
MCWLFGISRQAYYKHFDRTEQKQKEEAMVIELVDQIRKIHPRIGGRKLYYLLQQPLQEHGIQLGRDALFSLLRNNCLLIRRRRRKTITTWSNHPFRKYPNLIRHLELTAPNQLWVSDITYLKTQQGFVYLSLITDAYSRKIVGYDAASNLEAVNTLKALKMALQNTETSIQGLIHHSDRGIQYCTHEYTALLEKNSILISMTQTGDPLENPIAERVNGILKEEYLLVHPIKNLDHAINLLKKAVYTYNKQRPHLSCSLLTPEQVHLRKLPAIRLWKTYYRKKSNLVNQLQD